MDVTSIASLATAMRQEKTNQEIGIAVLKKAMDIDAAGALALIEALPQNPSAQNLPQHLGKNINTVA